MNYTSTIHQVLDHEFIHDRDQTAGLLHMANQLKTHGSNNILYIYKYIVREKACGLVKSPIFIFCAVTICLLC